MTPAEWREIKDLLAEALELPAGGRAAFLDLRCDGDPALQCELEGLLAASEGDGFLDGEPQHFGPAIAPGEVLGAYKVETKLAEGGMGEVYRAFDERLERRVAIKVLPARLSQDTAALARFERETKVLGGAVSSQHPGDLRRRATRRHGLRRHRAADRYDPEGAPRARQAAARDGDRDRRAGRPAVSRSRTPRGSSTAT